MRCLPSLVRAPQFAPPESFLNMSRPASIRTPLSKRFSPLDSSDIFSATSSRSGPGKRRSIASLHSLAKEHSEQFSYLNGDNKQDSSSSAGVVGSSRFSLAHELAAAMMPEPSVGSGLLAEEFGVEFDEGAGG